MRVGEMIVEAFRAGRLGNRLPNFGDRLTRDQVEAVNAAYEEARLWRAEGLKRSDQTPRYK